MTGCSARVAGVVSAPVAGFFAMIPLPFKSSALAR
jgi:hypothetical protein